MQSQSPGYKHNPPYDHGFLRVSAIHSIHYEQYGNPAGKPVIYLHSGPGGSTSLSSTVYFNPLIYRVILHDQRGSGVSRPHASLLENTSAHLVSDLESLRTHLRIQRWHLIFGSSWGSTLALLYAQAHPGVIGGLVLHSVPTFRKEELDALYRDVTPRIFPDLYAPFRDHIPEKERGDLVGAYYRRLCDADYGIRLGAALRWGTYEAGVGTLRFDSDGALAGMGDERGLLARSLLQAHYAVHGGFMEEGQLLREENVERVRGVPAYLVQGRYDMVVPVQSCFDLYTAWPECAVYIIPDAGHSAKEPSTHRKLVEICDSHAAAEYK
ncbi:MAG: hypothetical protein MMC23_006405 [Stictis urceolatum]|nr:hypothetical protein [Stictis urceolata]